MIEVTRLNGNVMILNSDLIKTAESSPDTMLTLITGEKMIVRESCAEILEKVLAFRSLLLAAIAARDKGAGDLPRLVALASLNPDMGQEGGRAGNGMAGISKNRPALVDPARGKAEMGQN